MVDKLGGLGGADSSRCRHTPAPELSPIIISYYILLKQHFHMGTNSTSIIEQFLCLFRFLLLS